MTSDDPLDAFERAAKRARHESLPTLDVTAAVMARIATRREARVLDPRAGATWLCLAASIAVAAFFGVLGAADWSLVTDPLGVVISTFTMEVP